MQVLLGLIDLLKKTLYWDFDCKIHFWSFIWKGWKDFNYFHDFLTLRCLIGVNIEPNKFLNFGYELCIDWQLLSFAFTLLHRLIKQEDFGEDPPLQTACMNLFLLTLHFIKIRIFPCKDCLKWQSYQMDCYDKVLLEWKSFGDYSESKNMSASSTHGRATIIYPFI